MSRTLPKYKIVENKIRHAIVCQELTGKIAGERVLAKEYGVSYMTLRKAIDKLVAENYLYRVPTRGTYVNMLATARGNSLMW